jgi:hypothetical protein
MLNSSMACAWAIVALALLGRSLVAQNDDGRLLELIRTTPMLNLERTEFVLEPRLPATSSTVGRAVSCVAVDRRGCVTPFSECRTR